MNSIKKIVPIEDLEVLREMPNTVIIRNHLIRYGSITAEEAKSLYGMARLSAVIHDLRHKREPLMVIDDVWESGYNRIGKRSHWVRYYFRGYVEDI